MPALLTRHATLAYTDEGAGPPVILVHGSASSRGQWRSAVLDFAPRYRVLAPDLHGYGGTAASVPPAKLEFDDEVELVDALADLAGGEVHLVGHSYGGAIALRAASLRPERVASLVLIEPTAFHLLRLLGEEAAWREIEAVALKHIALADAGDLAACADHFLGYWIGLDAWRAMPAEVRARIVQTMPKIAQEWRMTLAATDRYESVAAAGIPTLLVRGTATTLAARAVVELFRDQLPHASLVEIEGAGHMSPVTHARAVNAAIGQHLERSAGRG
jgi:pimeloyl-ACP methyl ester carboxylesterase